MNTLVFDAHRISPIPLAGTARRFAPALVLAFAALWGPSPGLAGPLLATAQSFAVLAGQTVTNTGATTVHGDLGVSPGAAVTGFPPGAVTGGATHAGDAVALQAQSDAVTAYNTLAGAASNFNLTGTDLGGLTLNPGVYTFSSSAQLTGALVLDALNNPNALFVFQIGTTLTTASDSVVAVTNGGANNGVFWQVGSSATLGTGTDFVGNIVALTDITLATDASILCGRAIARNGSVTMDGNVVSNDCAAEDFGSDRTDFGSAGFSGGSVSVEVGASAPEPSTLALLGLGLAGFIGFARRR